jgi:hypothetical protein
MDKDIADIRERIGWLLFGVLATLIILFGLFGWL